MIVIEVKSKIAHSPKDIIVCGNSGYEIQFNFDEEWNDHLTKTARFIVNGDRTIDVVFEGDTVQVPILQNALYVSVGVYAGDLVTTTPALIKCEKSILCGGGTPEEPTPDVYSQIISVLNDLVYRMEILEQENPKLAILGNAILGNVYLGG